MSDTAIARVYATALFDAATAAEYHSWAEKTRRAADRELWNENAGALVSIGSDGLSYSHPHSWEETLAINMGLLDPVRGRRAMRWVESRYGLQGARPEVRVALVANLLGMQVGGLVDAGRLGDNLMRALIEKGLADHADAFEDFCDRPRR